MPPISKFSAIPLEDISQLYAPSKESLAYDHSISGDEQQDSQKSKTKGAYRSIYLQEPSHGPPESRQDREPLVAHNALDDRLARYLRFTQNYWTYELMGLTVCVTTLISIVGVLFVFNGSPTPQIKTGVTVCIACLLRMSVSLTLMLAQYRDRSSLDIVSGSSSLCSRIGYRSTEVVMVCGSSSYIFGVVGV